MFPVLIFPNLLWHPIPRPVLLNAIARPRRLRFRTFNLWVIIHASGKLLLLEGFNNYATFINYFELSNLKLFVMSSIYHSYFRKKRTYETKLRICLQAIKPSLQNYNCFLFLEVILSIIFLLRKLVLHCLQAQIDVIVVGKMLLLSNEC